MKISRLVLGEVQHRKWNFLFSCAAVAFAVSCLAAAVGFLRAHDLETARMLGEMEAETRVSMKKFEDEIRKSMKGLGFNIYIFPEGQEMGEVHAQGYASKTMPEEYVTRLANSKIVTVNHLLPTLTQKLRWPETQRTVVLIGVRGEVPLAHRDLKKPLIDPVAAGKMVLGYELHKGLNLKLGDTLQFMNREFEVAKIHPERGSADDITIWMNLGECQELLEKEGRINAIQALECNCATIDRLGEIRAELLQILPGTKIIETQSTALARAEARVKAKELADKKIADAVAHREAMRQQREKMMGVMSPLITLLAMGLVALLAFLNVRDRLSEVGILRAIGVGRIKVLLVFLLRAILAGLAGAVIALALAGAIVSTGALPGEAGKTLTGLFTPQEILLVLLAAPLLAALAAWLPGLFAAQKDPAVVLRYD